MTDYLSIIAKVVGPTTAGIFAGYSWGLSRSCIPSILNYGSKDEASITAQWRNCYVDGARIARLSSIISAVSFGYLAYGASSGSLLRAVYIVSAIINASGVPYAFTFLRRTNGALCIRTKTLNGNYRKSGDTRGEPLACTYASGEYRSIAREKDPLWTTRRLLERWSWHNLIRAYFLALGTAIGILAVIMSERT